MTGLTSAIGNRLRSRWIELRPVRATKIVGVGLPKTGTTSLGYCFRRFGFRRFPGSKFVLTLRRDVDTYVRSLQHHHERQGIRRDDFRKPHWWDEVFGVEPSQWDYEKSAERYERHNREVREYFADRIDTDLLIVCWEQGDGWARLCRFLNTREPHEPFPHFR